MYLRCTYIYYLFYTNRNTYYANMMDLLGNRYLDRSGAFVTFCQNVRMSHFICENKMVDSNEIRHFVLTKCENFSLSDILTERNKST